MFPRRHRVRIGLSSMLSRLENTVAARTVNLRLRSAPNLRACSTGFSLVELMISIAVGLVVLGGVISIFASTVKSNADALEMTQLNQELRATMDVMSRDIRRSGYWFNAPSAVGPPATAASNDNPFEALVISKYGTEADFSCITYQYDADNDGNIDLGTSGAGVTSQPDERFGFRLREGAVEARQSGATCTAGGWENITDENNIVITLLQFILTAQPAIDLDGPSDPLSPAVCVTGCGTSTINVRGVQIVLEGRAKSDAMMTRRLTENALTRSDKWSAN